MNNSKIAFDNASIEEKVIDRSPLLRERETELVELIGALDHIRASNYWKIIHSKFSGDLQKLISQLKKEKDTTLLFRLQGEITRAEKLDLDKTAEECRNELSGIRKQLKNYEQGSDN